MKQNILLIILIFCFNEGKSQNAFVSEKSLRHFNKQTPTPRCI